MDLRARMVFAPFLTRKEAAKESPLRMARWRRLLLSESLDEDEKGTGCVEGRGGEGRGGEGRGGEGRGGEGRGGEGRGGEGRGKSTLTISGMYMYMFTHCMYNLCAYM